MTWESPIACIEPECGRPAAYSAVHCRVHLANALRREGETIPFEDPELAGLLAAAVHIVGSALAGLPEDLLDPHAPASEMDMYALLDPDADWRVTQAALDLLGTELADQRPIGRTVLSPPTEFASRILLRLRVAVPGPAVEELQPRLHLALEAMVREVLGPSASAQFAVEPADESDGSAHEIRHVVEQPALGDDSRVAAWVAAATRVTVLTGAGISTGSGIPDYRGPNGVWTKNPAAQRLVDINSYLADPGVRREAWQERLHHPAWRATPGPGHRALVDLERAGKLRTLVTQNIDGLHQAAGSSPAIVLELHGTIHRCRCLECGYETAMQEQLDRVRAGEPDPPCARCGGVQRSATVAFGQALDPDVVRRALEAAASCQVFLTVGTSLQVHPAARLCDVALDSGARLVVMNAEPTPYDHSAAAILRGEVGAVLPKIVGSA